ncbi:MAG: hypothetical protein JW822_13080 [Spirochaetales bacterium]|nr:hypothetical protein [Spirochaetales bacterium]
MKIAVMVPIGTDRNYLHFSEQCVRSGFSFVSVIGTMKADTHIQQIIEHLDACNISRDHLYFIPGYTSLNDIFSCIPSEPQCTDEDDKSKLALHYNLGPKDWFFINRHDLAVVSYKDGNFKELLKNKKDALVLAVDFLDVTAYYEIMNFMPQCAVSFLDGDSETVGFFLDYSNYLPGPIVINSRSQGPVILYKGKHYTYPISQTEPHMDSDLYTDSYQAAFIYSWFKTKDVRKAMRSAAKAAVRLPVHAAVMNT